MKIKELMSVMADSYMEIRINEYSGVKHTGRRWVIPPHSLNYQHIPKTVWEKEVAMVIPYYDVISIEINA